MQATYRAEVFGKK